MVGVEEAHPGGPLQWLTRFLTDEACVEGVDRGQKAF
jgi:hypothetical protein